MNADKAGMIVVVDDNGELAAFAWPVSLDPDSSEWYVELLDPDVRVTVDTRDDVDKVLALLDRPPTVEQGSEKYERDDPVTGEPVPSWVEGYSLTGRAAAAGV